MKIIFTKEAWDKINLYIEIATGEISGLGRAVLDKQEQVIKITDVGIWEQECTTAETEVTAHDKIIELAQEMIEQGAQMQELCVWWHSHAHMAAFFSGTDDKTIQNWINNKFLVAVVGNKKGEFKGRVAIKEPLLCEIDDVDVDYEEPENEELYTQIEQEIKEKVTEKKYPIVETKPYKYDKEKEKEIRDEEYALSCLCDHCTDFLAGIEKKFNFKQHTFNKTLKVWDPIVLEQQQIGAARRMEKDIPINREKGWDY